MTDRPGAVSCQLTTFQEKRPAGRFRDFASQYFRLGGATVFVVQDDGTFLTTSVPRGFAVSLPLTTLVPRAFAGALPAPTSEPRGRTIVPAAVTVAVASKTARPATDWS